MGLEKMGEEENTVRFQSSSNIGNIIDLKWDPQNRGNMGAGTVHHIAWRAKDDADQLDWKELYDFIEQAAKEYEFDRQNVIAIGYSNGANIAGSLLFHYQDALKGAILHHPMVPRRNIELPDLSNVQVFIGAGKNDPICSPEESMELQNLLEQHSASVHVHWEDSGHQLTQTEVQAAKDWYRSSLE